MSDGAPTKYDTGWFDDGDKLSSFIDDQRAADTATASTFEGAREIVAQFAAESGAGAWPSLDRAQVAARLEAIFTERPDDGAAPTVSPRSINQMSLNLCGPAAFLVMAAERDPVAVATYATTLFNEGAASIGSLEIQADEDLRSADYAAMARRGAQWGGVPPQAEWMMLGAVRNSTEVFWQPEWRGDPEQELAGMSRPEEVADWMRLSGIWSSVQDNGRWAANPGIPNATDLPGAEGIDVAVLLNTNLIDASVLTGVDGRSAGKPGTTFVKALFPNHWVVLLSEVVPDVQQEFLTFSIWTWGRRLVLRTPMNVFLKNYYGTVLARL